MKQIELTQNKFAIVDDEDFEYLNQWKWCYMGYKNRKIGYAVRTINLRKINGKRKTIVITMHSVINKTPKGLQTDHINRNSLDNRKINLRTVTNQINAINVGLQSNNTSGFKGITWDKSRNKWFVRIKFNGKHINLGRYCILQDAIKTRKLAEQKYFQSLMDYPGVPPPKEESDVLEDTTEEM